MSKFHDDRTEASDRVQIDVSEEMLRRLEPELFGWRSLFFKFNWANAKLGARRTIELIAEHMTFGDSRAAIVIQSSPLVVAAYTDELDCVEQRRRDQPAQTGDFEGGMGTNLGQWKRDARGGAPDSRRPAVAFLEVSYATAAMKFRLARRSR